MDEKSLTIGTFNFRYNATLPATTPNLASVYTTDLGEILNGTLKPGGDLKEAWDSINGVLGLVKLIRTKRTLDFEGDIQKLDPALVLPLYMGAASGAAPAPGKITDVFGYLALQAEDEPVVGGTSSNKGEGIFVWHSFPCGIWIEGDLKADGSDYSQLKLMVRAYLGRGRGLYTCGARPITPAA